jgi:hypothetical protein
MGGINVNMITDDENEINNEIKNMGYILATSSKIIPNYYKLKDNTILKVIVIINHLIPEKDRPDNLGINSTNIISTFVPIENRKPDLFKPYPLTATTNEANIIEQDLEFEVVSENFTVYNLSNGFLLKVKPVLAQVNKTKLFSFDGEPIFTVNIAPVIKITKPS